MNPVIPFLTSRSWHHSPRLSRSKLPAVARLGLVIVLLAWNEASQPRSGVLIDVLARIQPRIKKTAHAPGRPKPSPAERDALVQSELRKAALATEIFYAFNGNSYVGRTVGDFPNFGYRRRPSVGIEVMEADNHEFRLKAQTQGGTARSWIYDSASGATIPGD